VRVALLLDKQQVWPATTLELKAAKLLHEFQLGENMSVKQLLGCSQTHHPTIASRSCFPQVEIRGAIWQL
jgi:hypothetical protein